MKCLCVLIWIAGTIAGLLPAHAQGQYTGDGNPTGQEEEIRWRLNRGRFDTAAENQTRGTSYTDVPASAGPLAPNQSLTLAARHQSEDMARHNLFQHATVPGSAYYNPVTQPNPWDRMTAEGYSWNVAAENIAAGYTSAEAVYVGWWNSTGHRQNMYNRGLREIGNGTFYWSSSTYGVYYTMDLASSGNNCFLTDTLFDDANGNSIYDSGEGVAGLSVTLIVSGSPYSIYDLSTSVGSFAIPIQTIAAGTIVQVILSNTTTASLTFSVPRDYRTLATIILAPGKALVIGNFIRPATTRNIGFRDLVPGQSPVVPPPLVVAPSDRSILLSWSSDSSLQYQPQWTANFLIWSNLTGAYQSGTGSNMTFLDGSAIARGSGFYRLLVHQP